MRIAVINPVFLFQDQKKNFNGYNYIFFKKYVSVIFLTDPRRYRAYKKFLRSENINHVKMTYSVHKLNRLADVVISFNGVPNLFQHRIPKGFIGMKVCHLMDFVFYAKKASEALRRSKVDYVLGYSKHDNFCEFFKKYYPWYVGKVISVPFGYGSRFENKTPYNERINKAIALGAVNPVKDMKGEILREYSEFYKNEEFTHVLRRRIVLNRGAWKSCIDDLLPTYPETKNSNYNPVDELNKYTMFINDAGLMNFPPARTYEGIACGCVMVAEDTGIWEEMGFKDGENCILFPKGNYEEMIRKIEYYCDHFDELMVIREKSCELAKNFTHSVIAERLFNDMKERYDKWFE